LSGNERPLGELGFGDLLVELTNRPTAVQGFYFIEGAGLPVVKLYCSPILAAYPLTKPASALKAIMHDRKLSG
jgi:hypothetical protein